MARVASKQRPGSLFNVIVSFERSFLAIIDAIYEDARDRQRLRVREHVR